MVAGTAVTVAPPGMTGRRPLLAMFIRLGRIAGYGGGGFGNRLTTDMLGAACRNAAPADADPAATATAPDAAAAAATDALCIIPACWAPATVMLAIGRTGWSMFGPILVFSTYSIKYIVSLFHLDRNQSTNDDSSTAFSREIKAHRFRNIRGG